MILSDAGVVPRRLHELVEASQFCRVTGELFTCVACQLLATCPRPVEREAGIVVLVQPNIALNRVEWNRRIFTPGRVADFVDTIAAPPVLVQVRAQVNQKCPTFVRLFKRAENGSGVQLIK